MEAAAWAHLPASFLPPIPRLGGFSAPADGTEMGECNYVATTLEKSITRVAAG